VVSLRWGIVTVLILAWDLLLYIHWGELTLGYSHCVNISLGWLLYIHWGELTLGYSVNISLELATVYTLGLINPGVQ